MKYDLARLAKQAGARASKNLPVLEPTTALEIDLRRTTVAIVRAWSQVIQTVILPIYAAAIRTRVTFDADTSTLSSTLESAGRDMQRLVVALSPDVRRWAVRVDKWHLSRFVMAVKSIFGVDVTPYQSEEIARETIEVATQRNVALIRGLSDDIQRKVERAVWDAFQQRTPISKLSSELMEIIGSSRKRANFIARDQLSKLSADADQMRQQEAGIDSYVWKHSRKANPRKEHVARNGRIFKWKRPPPDGHPGHAPNCGCKAQAHVEL